MSLREGLRLLRAGQWDAAHPIAQADPSDLGSWLHGIVHMAEPDEWNSRYWYRAAGRVASARSPRRLRQSPQVQRHSRASRRASKRVASNPTISQVKSPAASATLLSCSLNSAPNVTYRSTHSTSPATSHMENRGRG